MECSQNRAGQTSWCPGMLHTGDGIQARTWRPSRVLIVGTGSWEGPWKAGKPWMCLQLEEQGDRLDRQEGVWPSTTHEGVRANTGCFLPALCPVLLFSRDLCHAVKHHSTLITAVLIRVEAAPHVPSADGGQAPCGALHTNNPCNPYNIPQRWMFSSQFCRVGDWDRSCTLTSPGSHSWGGMESCVPRLVLCHPSECTAALWFWLWQACFVLSAAVMITQPMQSFCCWCLEELGLPPEIRLEIQEPQCPQTLSKLS